MNKKLFRFLWVWGFLFGILAIEIGVFVCNNSMFKADGAIVVFAIFSIVIVALSLALTLMVQFCTAGFARIVEIVHAISMILAGITLVLHGWHYSEKSLVLEINKQNSANIDKSSSQISNIAKALTDFNTSQAGADKAENEKYRGMLRIQQNNLKLGRNVKPLELPPVKVRDAANINNVVREFAPKVITDNKYNEIQVGNTWIDRVRIGHGITFLWVLISFSLSMALIRRYIDLDQNGVADEEETTKPIRP